MVTFLFGYYRRENKRREVRDARHGSTGNGDEGRVDTGDMAKVEAWRDMTDKENLKFIYVY